MIQEKESTTPEQRMKKLALGFIKKAFLIIVTWIGYWQLYEYVTDRPEITVIVEDPVRKDKVYKTLLSVENGSESISSDDIVRPINLTFNDSILKLNPFASETKPNFKINNKSISIRFDLLNKNEKFQFFILSIKKVQLISAYCRIKNIKSIVYYDTENKPKPIVCILNIWIILLLSSIVLFIDALLVIVKDRELGQIKDYINKFPISQNSIEDFLTGYRVLYGKYRLRLKPSSDFMQQIIANLFISFPYKTKAEIESLKYMANLKTELYIFYRSRTAFIIISPIVMLISLFGSTVNYFYYDFDRLRNHISLSEINIVLLRILLIAAFVIILFPRRTMTLLFVKSTGHTF